jgi:hypothetical protein
MQEMEAQRWRLRVASGEMPTWRGGDLRRQQVRRKRRDIEESDVGEKAVAVLPDLYFIRLNEVADTTAFDLAIARSVSIGVALFVRLAAASVVVRHARDGSASRPVAVRANDRLLAASQRSVDEQHRGGEIDDEDVHTSP